MDKQLRCGSTSFRTSNLLRPACWWLELIAGLPCHDGRLIYRLALRVWVDVVEALGDEGGEGRDGLLVGVKAGHGEPKPVGEVVVAPGMMSKPRS